MNKKFNLKTLKETSILNNKSKHCRISIFTKDKYYINLIEKLLKNQICVWNKTKNSYRIKKKINVQILRKKKFTLLKSPHVHKKAKKTFERHIFKINIFLETSNSNLKFYTFINNNLIYNLPKVENITYKIWTSNKSLNSSNIIQNLYKKKIDILKKIKSILELFTINNEIIKIKENQNILIKLIQKYIIIKNKIILLIIKNNK